MFRAAAVLVGSLMIGIPQLSFSQSTSPWVPINAQTQATPSITPDLGASYLTVEFLASRIYQNSNWWTNLVEDNRKAIIDASLSGKVRNINFEDNRASRPIELKRNKSQSDPGWRSFLAVRLPTTYSNLQLTVRISKSSQDGLDALLGTLAALSASTPGLQLSQTALGAVTATKQISDYLFQKNLLEEKLTSTIQFPDTGASLPAGIYVAFAADTANEYDAYLAKLTGSSQGLTWTGAQLLWNGKPIEKISYFVIRVQYDTNIFSNPINALSFNAAKPWAALYQLARRKVGTISKQDEIQRTSDEIRSHLINAQTLLDDDPDFTQLERDNIHNSLLANTQQLLDARINKINPPISENPLTPHVEERGHTSPVKPGTVILTVPNSEFK